MNALSIPLLTMMESRWTKYNSRDLKKSKFFFVHLEKNGYSRAIV